MSPAFFAVTCVNAVLVDAACMLVVDAITNALSVHDGVELLPLVALSFLAIGLWLTNVGARQ